MKKDAYIFCIVLSFCAFVIPAKAQLLKKIKQKAEEAVEKKISKKDKEKEDPASAETGETSDGKPGNAPSGLKVYSKFDFVPGSTILYYDNFEKDNIGEAPMGWITSTSAELVTIEGLEGHWLKLAATQATHLSRNKKQSWGDDFTVEFDMLIVEKTSYPRIQINLYNTGGNLVTDEDNLRNNKPVINFSAILSDKGTNSRISLYAGDKELSDGMSNDVGFGSAAPVHISICVQGKRFRMWWKSKKLYDLSAISKEYLPNQLGFGFGPAQGFDFYVSNFRVAKDVPDTRARFEQGKLISNLLFYTGTDKLKPESMGSLLDVSKIVKEATAPVKIVGHTDSDVEDAANQKLSVQRAEAVKAILIKEYNIDESKLTTEGRGETQPLADNTTAEGKAQNRRVEFIFKPEADIYKKPAGTTAPNSKPAANNNKPVANTPGKTTENTGAGAVVKLQSRILTTNLPYAQFMKTGEYSYTFIAGKEEGNTKENFIKIELESANTKLKPETFNFIEINKKNPLYGTKKYGEIKNTSAVLYYGQSKKPYIYAFSPIIANGHLATYIKDQGLETILPPVSPNCKFVVEKVEDGKAGGYFIAGIMIEGQKPIIKGGAERVTFTNGFSGEIKFQFANVPVY
jgi:outer membrane protein OmpA-like peptidoglycan-associated protein